MRKERLKKGKSLYKRQAYRLHRIFVLLIMILLMLLCNIDRMAYLFHAEDYMIYEASCKEKGHDQLIGIVPIVEVSFVNNKGEPKILENSYMTPILYGYRHAAINWKPVDNVMSLIKTKLLAKLGKKGRESDTIQEESSIITDVDKITIAVSKEKENTYIYLLPFWRCPVNIFAPIVIIFCLFPCKQLFVTKKKAKVKVNKKQIPTK